VNDFQILASQVYRKSTIFHLCFISRCI